MDRNANGSKAKRSGRGDGGFSPPARRVPNVPVVITSTEFAPAKLNLFLAVAGKRPDGFHELVSVVSPVAFGDLLTVEPADDISLVCSAEEVPTDHTNLIVKAARAFQRASGWSQGAKFTLEKRIPLGAGLGGGSSDAVATLRALNRLAGNPLDFTALMKLAAELGSDCPLFLHEAPVMIRGRGERVEPLPVTAASRLRGQRVLIFKPGFGIATPWAYAQLAAAAPGSYLPTVQAEARVSAWMTSDREPVEALLFNNMEPVAFAKFVALPTLLEMLRTEFGLQSRMSGSGSACFAVLPPEAPVTAIAGVVRQAWGPSSFVVETVLL